MDESDDIRKEIDRLRWQCELEPRKPENWSELGSLYLVVNEPGRARECFERVVGLKPDADAHCSLGTASLVQGDLKIAAASFEKSLLLDPSHLRATTGLGFVHLRLGQIGKSKSLLMKSVSENPTNPEVQFALAKIAVIAGDFLQSIERCAVALRHEPFDPVGTLLLMGDSFLAAGAMLECEQTYSAAVLTDEDSIAARAGLAQVHIFMGHEDTAEHELEEASKRDPKSPLPHIVWGSLWMMRAKADRARDAYQQALTLDDGCVDAWAGLGAAFLTLDEISKARAAASHGLERLPNHVGCLLVMAQTSELMGEFDECASLAERALKNSPKQWHAHLLWARAEIALRRDAQKAVEHLKLAEQFAPPGQAKKNAHTLLVAMEQARTE